MDMSGKLHAPAALPRRKNPSTLWIEGLVLTETQCDIHPSLTKIVNESEICILEALSPAS